MEALISKPQKQLPILLVMRAKDIGCDRSFQKRKPKNNNNNNNNHVDNNSRNLYLCYKYFIRVSKL